MPDVPEQAGISHSHAAQRCLPRKIALLAQVPLAKVHESSLQMQGLNGWHPTWSYTAPFNKHTTSEALTERPAL